MVNTHIGFYGSTILDINDHIAFSKDCAYKPKVEIKYKESVKK
jgi:hypothetical protein